MVEGAFGDVAESGAGRGVEGGTNVGHGIFQLVIDALLGPSFDA